MALALLLLSLLTDLVFSGNIQLVRENVPDHCETKAEVGDYVTIHYSGKFPDGRLFESSRIRKEPFNFTLGKRSVIKGWEQGIPGIEKRILTIPPELGYGPSGYPPTIPPNTDLVFDIDLVAVIKADRSNEGSEANYDLLQMFLLIPAIFVLAMIFTWRKYHNIPSPRELRQARKETWRPALILKERKKEPKKDSKKDSKKDHKKGAKKSS